MLSELLPEEKRRLNELEFQLSQLSDNKSSILPSDVNAGLTEMEFRLVELDKLADKEPRNRKDDCKRRIHHLRTIHGHIKSGLDQYLKKINPYITKKRELFLGADIEGGANHFQVEESNSLERSNRMLDSYIDMGQFTLTNLSQQKENLKSIQRKVFDLLNYMGLSNSLLKSIENRDTVDKWIVYGGMVFIIFLLLIIWLWLRK
jgi:Golgi SNAP receptor complex protein 2